MRALVQRVSEARVEVGAEITGEIERGLLVLLGVASADGSKQVAWMVDKLAGLRIFDDEEGKMNLSVEDVGGAMLVVSQFTLYGDCRRGKRPSFIEAAPPEHAEAIYQQLVEQVAARGIPVATGRFRHQMQVSLVNDGPVTIWIESP
jgi:D-tyrosyl-tRNA(Tyr) deacylase